MRKTLPIAVFIIAPLLGGCSTELESQKADVPAVRVMKAAQAQPQSAAPMAEDAKYVGSRICAQCHKVAMEKYARTLMGKTMNAPERPGLQRVDCESCHGPGSAHVAAGGGRGKGIQVTFRSGAEPVERQNAACLTCHEKGERRYWKGSPHNSRDVACVSCHTVMEKVSDRFALAKPTQNETCAQCHLIRGAQLYRRAHMASRYGKLQCSGCHKPHGSVTEKLLKGNSINETCYSCHPEKRGPFLWEHAPVRENCSTCHEPHGTLNEKLLKVRMPRLCNRCHTGTFHPSTPQLPTARVVFNRACMNCHNRIHGSNHPSGMFFVR